MPIHFPRRDANKTLLAFNYATSNNGIWTRIDVLNLIQLSHLQPVFVLFCSCLSGCYLQIACLWKNGPFDRGWGVIRYSWNIFETKRVACVMSEWGFFVTLILSEEWGIDAIQCDKGGPCHSFGILLFTPHPKKSDYSFLYPFLHLLILSSQPKPTDRGKCRKKSQGYDPFPIHRCSSTPCVEDVSSWS